MFTDMTLSSEINDKFKEFLSSKSLDNGKGIYLSYSAHPIVDFSVLVLTAGSWPLQTQASSFNVPLEVTKQITY